MALRIYNTLTGTVEELIPGGKKMENAADYPPVTIYSCGPTVYSNAHIGNFRTFLFNDFLRRYLKFRGFRVNHAMNITDVDDKTIAGSREKKLSLREFTDGFISLFFRDLEQLNIEKVEHVPRATESMDAMIDILQRLHDRGLMYEKDGSLYFSISRFPAYGALSRLESREIKTGTRYDTDEYEKDDIRDFALWKQEEDPDVSWETPFGRGRPGWHIECSAMIRRIFGGTIDIHTGGVDLVFPHHENEIAQSEGAYGEKFVRRWIHVEHLLVEGSKMSKSKGNFFKLGDLLEKGYSSRAIRYLLLSAHYKKQLNFTLKGLDQAGQALSRIDNLLTRLADEASAPADSERLLPVIQKFYDEFTAAVDDDLNISKGTGIFFDFLHSINSLIDEGALSRGDSERIMEHLRDIDRVFGFIFFPAVDAGGVDADGIERLIQERIAAKQGKDFKRADEIRGILDGMGVVLEDTKSGTRWKLKK